MSLVAYEYSDDESSGEEPEDKIQTKPTAAVKLNGSAGRDNVMEIEDDEEPSAQHLHLPAPKKINDLSVEEEDDEFLHKKATAPNVPVPKPPPSLNLPSKPNVRNGKVQITIPSMKDFKDDGETEAGPKKGKPVIGAALPKKTTNLLSMLPKPRTAIFSAPRTTPTTSVGPVGTGASTTISKRLVPDSVANRPRSVPMSAAKPAKPSKSTNLAPSPDSGDEDDDGDEQMVDFFSFNKVDDLPAVSTNEITAMVAKKAAKIAENVRKYTEPEEELDGRGDSTGPNETMSNDADTHLADPSEDLATETALSALIGGNRAKRARVEQVDLIEITSSDIVPSKEDFLRRQLQDETGYVATGHLVGDWTCTSKRKSHITQLASKAQANAQELEAMWAANRQSRRQTQSKYGF